MSVDARGKIADAMVFMGWKGLKTVRMWLKPKNPDTVAQQGIRDKFSTAVTKHHLLDSPAKVAWNARTSGQALSGFNLFLKKVVDCLIAAKTWALYTAISAGSITAIAADIAGTSDNAALVKCKYGIATGVYLYETDEVVGRAAPGVFEVILVDLTANTKYFYMITMKTADGVVGESGEYSFTTLAA
jgi:hypothetical protein